MMMYYQYMLKKVHPTLNEYKVCWCDKMVDKGAVITLKDLPDKWKVIKRYNSIALEVLALNRNPNWCSV